MPENTLHVEAAAVALANRLIVDCDVDIPRISSLSELTSSFYINLFEIIFKSAVTDLIVPACSIQEEEHNIQSIIDTLSMDILSISLCHISGEAIIGKNPHAVYNLLEIFLGYFLLITTSLEQKDLSNFHLCQVCKYNAEILDTHFDDIIEIQKYLLPDEPDKLEYTQVKPQPQHVMMEEEISKNQTDDDTSEEKRNTDTISKMSDAHTSQDLEVENELPNSSDAHTCQVLEVENDLPDSIKSSETSYPVFTCELFDTRQTASTHDQVVKLTESQIRLLTSRLHSLFMKKTRVHQLYEKAIQRQQDLLKIAKEDIVDSTRLKLHKEGRDVKIKIKSAFDAHSMRRVRMKKIFEKYYLQHRSQMIAKDRTKEEVDLIHLLKARLALQKEKLHTLNRDVRQFEAERYLYHQNKISSLENFYEDKLSLLKEQQMRNQISHEIRKKSHAQEMQKLKLQNRLKLENEIQFMQANILCDPFT